ncbi:GNAT family N-acetyltransferase [Bacillus sp. DX1.1]|uniref:GNAT family N-acetyltransferase n=1 Tax=unclassified Bacillus (in: firmicutes) TaxID=185979 RepID=UPI00256FA932|nr:MULTISPECIES: GNAT family N-acetyltransferase [unclassified Bacillus (in: firmicutes)]MDM5155063.1 GNAT family N-acetyltransferase [Bacillus sp. DX1.1]WJE83923.1 GNAT family N-acetyltransferase [Bacillus sp. DX3.1]
MVEANVVIRQATEQDWQTLWYLLQTRSGTDGKERAQQRFLSIIKNPDHFLPVAFVNDKVAGYGWIQNYGPHLRSGKSIHRFHDLFVLKDFRNKGIAAALFQQIKLWSEQTGAAWLQWNANPTSASFYEKLGYHSIPEEEKGFPFFEIEFN